MERHKTMFGETPEKIQMGGLVNKFMNRLKHSYDTNLDCMEVGSSTDGGHKPKINREVIETKQKEHWGNAQQYPYEMFIEYNRHNLSKFTEITKNEKDNITFNLGF